VDENMGGRSGRNNRNGIGDVLANEPVRRIAERTKKIQTSGRARPALERCTLICAAILAVFLLCPGIVMAGTPTVTISDYHVNPAVLMPGDTGTISFTLTTTDQSARESQSTGATAGNSFANTESTAINVHIYNVHVEGNGIIIQSADFDRVGDLGPGQSLPLTVLIRAPEKEGIYFPEVWIDTGSGLGSGVSMRYPIPVNVNTRVSLSKGPDLSLQKTIPASVVPGDDFTCNLTLRNDGEGRADDIFIAINSTVSSLSLRSPANYHLDHLDPGADASFDLQFATDKDAPLGISIVPVTINYAASDGTKENLAENLGIPLKGKAKISVKSLITDPIQPAISNPIVLTIRIENTGTDRTDSVKATLDTPLTGTKEAFIGSIDKNSDAPAIFYLKASQNGDIPLAVTITYDDDYGTHVLTENATVTVSGSNGSSLAIVVLIIALAGAGAAYWFLRIRKREYHG
jgi:hypothetical protein